MKTNNPIAASRVQRLTAQRLTETDSAEATTGNNIVDDPLFDIADAFDESDREN